MYRTDMFETIWKSAVWSPLLVKEIGFQSESWRHFYETILYILRELGKMNLNDTGRKKIEKRKEWQQAKHAKLYSDSLDSQRKGSICVPSWDSGHVLIEC